MISKHSQLLGWVLICGSALTLFWMLDKLNLLTLSYLWIYWIQLANLIALFVLIGSCKMNGTEEAGARRNYRPQICTLIYKILHYFIVQSNCAIDSVTVSETIGNQTGCDCVVVVVNGGGTLWFAQPTLD